MDIWMALTFGAGLWTMDIIWFFIKGKKEGHNFKYYLGRGGVKFVIFMILMGSYIALTP